MVMKFITLYYDSYEAKFGDGFYPQTQPDRSCSDEIEIGFELVHGTWTQVTGPRIHGYDGNEYTKVMRILNKE